jgi:tetratricopeptide (TPR) repeat protein
VSPIRCSTARPALLGLAALLALALPSPAGAQTHLARTTLAPTSGSEQAATAFQDALDSRHQWLSSRALEQARRATELDPSLGVGRALVALLHQGPDQMAEFDRAVADAATASTVELLMAAGWREIAAGRPAAARVLLGAARTLHPGDPRVVFEHVASLAPAARLTGLRELAEVHPTFAPGRAALAYWLTVSTINPATPADAELALASAREALRLAPDQPYSQAVMAHVLARGGRRDEARVHLQSALANPPGPEYAHELLAELELQARKPAEARRIFTAAAAETMHAGQRHYLARLIALTHLYEGDLATTVRLLEAEARQAEAEALPFHAGMAHRFLTVVQAGARNAPALERHMAEATRLAGNDPGLAEWAVIAYAIAGQGSQARAMLTSFLAAQEDPASPTATEARHRATGLVLLAEGRAAEAVGELERGGRNAWAQVGLVEAHQKLGRRREADAVRDDLLTRTDFAINSLAIPVAAYRYGKR